MEVQNPEDLLLQIMTRWELLLEESRALCRLLVDLDFQGFDVDPEGRAPNKLTDVISFQ